MPPFAPVQNCPPRKSPIPKLWWCDSSDLDDASMDKMDILTAPILLCEEHSDDKSLP